jgi:hypothetical protein
MQKIHSGYLVDFLFPSICYILLLSMFYTDFSTAYIQTKLVASERGGGE